MKVKVFHIRLTKEYLQADQDTVNIFMDNILVKKTATELISGQLNYWSILVFYDEKNPYNISKRNKIIVEESELTTDEKDVFKALKQWRQDKATQLQIPNFMICHNSELATIARVKPQDMDELLTIKGFSRRKTAKFGDDIIALLNSI